MSQWVYGGKAPVRPRAGVEFLSIRCAILDYRFLDRRTTNPVRSAGRPVVKNSCACRVAALQGQPRRQEQRPNNKNTKLP
jgi:hypothetical protein